MSNTKPSNIVAGFRSSADYQDYTQDAALYHIVAYVRRKLTTEGSTAIIPDFVIRSYVDAIIESLQS